MDKITIERIIHKLFKIANSHRFDIHVIVCGSLVLLSYIVFLYLLKKNGNYKISKCNGRLLDVLMSGISGILYLMLTQISPLINFTIFSTIYACLFPMGVLGIKRHVKKNMTDLLLICLALIIAIIMFCFVSCENNHFKMCILLKSFICAMGVFELVESAIIIWRREE